LRAATDALSCRQALDTSLGNQATLVEPTNLFNCNAWIAMNSQGRGLGVAPWLHRTVLSGNIQPVQLLQKR
jgi:hypothetical protein